MMKVNGWLMTLVGVVWLLPMIGVSLGTSLSNWLIGLSFLVMGLTKLYWAYGKKGKK